MERFFSTPGKSFPVSGLKYAYCAIETSDPKLVVLVASLGISLTSQGSSDTVTRRTAAGSQVLLLKSHTEYIYIRAALAYLPSSTDSVVAIVGFVRQPGMSVFDTSTRIPPPGKRKEVEREGDVQFPWFALA